ncbi:hypothetical protein, partial [Burkholderia pseudomallei]|uniref:hypothetical protein n=1 Tax=Burkholderia pseudomallei TaxID=28450 RepID=UPI001F1BCE45
MAGFRSKGGVERRATRPAARTALRRFAMPLFQHFVAASSRHPPIAGTMPRQSAMPGSPRSDFRGVAQLNHPQFPTVSGAFLVHRRKPWSLGERLRNLTPDFMDVRRRNCSIA